jgi:hypothetical protein
MVISASAYVEDEEEAESKREAKHWQESVHLKVRGRRTEFYQK